MTLKFSQNNPDLIPNSYNQCEWVINNPFGTKYAVVNVLNISSGQQQLCDIVQTDTTITIYIDTDENIQADTLVAIIMA